MNDGDPWGDFLWGVMVVIGMAVLVYVFLKYG